MITFELTNSYNQCPAVLLTVRSRNKFFADQPFGHRRLEGQRFCGRVIQSRNQVGDRAIDLVLPKIRFPEQVHNNSRRGFEPIRECHQLAAPVGWLGECPNRWDRRVCENRCKDTA